MLNNFILGLQLIEKVDPEPYFQTNSDGVYVSEASLFTDTQLETLEGLGFDIDEDMDCLTFCP